jgi:dTDP-glucose pyrophosphorylase
MNVIITMAGLGSRFRKAGYKVPKYEIEVKGKTLFEWSMLSLSDYFNDADSRFNYIVRKEDNASNFINSHCAELGIKNAKIIEIDELTDGQATSAMLAERYWKADDGMLVYNIDTYVEPGYLLQEKIAGDGFIPCFNADGDHWSFVRLDENGKAVEVREKQRISDNCTIGLYYFKTCDLYSAIYNEYYSDDKNLEKGEKYIAPLYNYMINKGFEVRIDVIPADRVHVLGTPDEVEVFKNEK